MHRPGLWGRTRSDYLEQVVCGRSRAPDVQVPNREMWRARAVQAHDPGKRQALCRWIRESIRQAQRSHRLVRIEPRTTAQHNLLAAHMRDRFEEAFLNSSTRAHNAQSRP